MPLDNNWWNHNKVSLANPWVKVLHFMASSFAIEIDTVYIFCLKWHIHLYGSESPLYSLYFRCRIFLRCFYFHDLPWKWRFRHSAYHFSKILTCLHSPWLWGMKSSQVTSRSYHHFHVETCPSSLFVLMTLLPTLHIVCLRAIP